MSIYSFKQLLTFPDLFSEPVSRSSGGANDSFPYFAFEFCVAFECCIELVRLADTLEIFNLMILMF